jgi:hypothetical protein
LKDKLYGGNAMSMESMLKVVRTVCIPRDLLEEIPAVDVVRVYALSKNTIGISFYPEEEWEERAIWKGNALVKVNSKDVEIEMPEPISRFYDLRNPKVSVIADELIHIYVE